MTTLKLTREEHRIYLAQCFYGNRNGKKIPITAATHWLRPEPINSALTDKKQLDSIACGYEATFTGRCTREWRLVTCLACMQLAIGQEP